MSEINLIKNLNASSHRIDTILADLENQNLSDKWKKYYYQIKEFQELAGKTIFHFQEESARYQRRLLEEVPRKEYKGNYSANYSYPI
jgi:ribosomal protein S3AE